MSVGRYRPIFVRIWGDEKFRNLSKGTANAQMLWFYMLTNPLTTIIPGLYSAGKATLGQGIGWSPQKFGTFYNELEKAVMVQSDWDAKVVWIPQGIRYQKPHNPQVVKGWDKAWPEIPECDIKRDAHSLFSEVLLSWGPSYQKAFVESCPITPPITTPVTEASPYPSRGKQDQEVESEARPRTELRVVARHLVSGHQLDRRGREDSHTVQFAAVQQHL